MTKTIHLDAGSIHAELSRRYPRMEVAKVWLNKTSESYWATCLDITGVPDGPADIAWNERFMEDYHGFQIEMLRLVRVPADYWCARRAD